VGVSKTILETRTLRTSAFICWKETATVSIGDSMQETGREKCTTKVHRPQNEYLTRSGMRQKSFTPQKKIGKSANKLFEKRI
jgi:hypothetical protein